jgi:hypothetical protein
VDSPVVPAVVLTTLAVGTLYVGLTLGVLASMSWVVVIGCRRSES